MTSSRTFPELPDHHDGDHNDWEHPQVVVLVPRIPKTYNMLGINWTNPIKTPILLQMTTSRSFPELPDHHDGDHHDWEHPQVVVLTQTVVLMYNTWGPSCL